MRSPPPGKVHLQQLMQVTEPVVVLLELRTLEVGNPASMALSLAPCGGSSTASRRPHPARSHGDYGLQQGLQKLGQVDSFIPVGRHFI